MTELRLTIWNVLHRVHAENWGEDAVQAFPDEAVRIARVTETVCGFLASGVCVVCLQEVSGDQLASLAAAVGPQVVVLDHLYPRVPRLRRPGPQPLADPAEHLVVLSAVAGTCRGESMTFESDPGKGYLAVTADGARITCTHVSYGARRYQQLAALAAVARSAAAPAVVAGDFNAEVDAVRSGLGPDFLLSDLTGQPCTRVATSSSQAHTIDHVAALRGSLAAARVLDEVGLSDHNPVEVVFAFG